MTLNQRISPNLSEKVSSQQAPVLKQAGFTLVEVLIVVAILGILTGVGAGSWASYREASRVESAKGKLVSILQQARLKAISSGFSQVITLDYKNENIVTVSGEIIAFEGVNIEGYKKSGATCVTNNPNLPKTLVFNRRGTVGGTSLKSIKVSSPGSTSAYVIKVYTVTGRIKVVAPC